MSVPNVLGKIKGTGKVGPPKFLALVVTDELVQAAVWHVVGGQTEIVALGTPVEWDGDSGTTNELVSAADATVSSSLDGVAGDPSELIIGVDPSWVDQKGILGAKRELIKAICKDMELQALGFVVLTDSTLHYLKQIEGTPTTCILVNVSRDSLNVLLVRLGRIEGSEVVGRGDDIVTDLEEAVSRFPAGDHLPSRIIVQSCLESPDELTQSLLSADWATKFNFLHIPKIEALPRDTAIRSVALAGGTEVAKAIGFAPDLPSGTAPTPQSVPAPEVPPAVQAAEPESPPPEEPAVLTAADVGFSVGTPAAAKPVVADEDELLDPTAPPDIAAKPVKIPRTLPQLTLPQVKLPHFTMPTIKLPSFTGSKLPLVIGAVVLGVLLILSFIFLYWLPRASIMVMLTPKPLEESVELTLDPTANSVNLDTGVVPATTTTKVVSSSSTAPTTGDKTVGDPATGSVTIYNRTTLAKTFLKGTSLTGNGLKFTLDSDVTVASKSAGADYVDVPGKATVELTASAIGEAGNLAAGSEFTLASFSKDTYVAKNDTALKSGHSEQVKVVSPTDAADLTRALTTTLVNQAKTELDQSGTPGDGYYVLEKTAKVTNQSMTPKVGAEGDSVTATLELELNILRYSGQDVEQLVSSRLDQAIPDGYARIAATPVVTLTGGDESEAGSVQANAKVTVNLLPTIDTRTLATSLKGKNTTQALSLLQSLPGYTGAKFQITPLWLPPRLKSLPHNPDHISISLTPSL